MTTDITDALRDGPLSLGQLAAQLRIDESAVRRRLDVEIAAGRVEAQHLQTLPPRTLYRLPTGGNRPPTSDAQPDDEAAAHPA